MLFPFCSKSSVDFFSVSVVFLPTYFARRSAASLFSQSHIPVASCVPYHRPYPDLETASFLASVSKSYNNCSAYAVLLTVLCTLRQDLDTFSSMCPFLLSTLPVKLLEQDLATIEMDNFHYKLKS